MPESASRGGGGGELVSALGEGVSALGGVCSCGGMGGVCFGGYGGVSALGGG